MKIALAQINTRVGDIAGNFERIAAFTARAKDAGADMVVFPEMAVNGFPPMDLLEKPRFVRTGLEKLEEVARLADGIAIVCGYVDENRPGRPCRNSLALCVDGRIAVRVHKCLLPTHDVSDDDRYFAPATIDEIAPVEFAGLRIGFSIGADIWDDRLYDRQRHCDFDPIETLVRKGADILVNISASPYQICKRGLKYEMLADVAARHKLPLVAVNMVGGNTELIFDGCSVAFDKTGAAVARAKSFEEDLIVFDTDAIGAISDKPPLCEEASLLSALRLGLRDYLHKSGFAKAVIGLSGGIDSAVVAAIAVEALGADNVLGVAMPSRYSSESASQGAEDLARNLGIELRHISIEPMFETFLAQMGPHFAGLPEDATEENLQARIRGNILMALSNKLGHIVLATGNKSELAMGYCTLYGDMTGGLCVIGDVPKTMVYRLARHINRDGEVIPEDAITRAPSAELRPEQTDQDSLPPYEVLDEILRAYILERRELDEIVALGFEPELVARVLRTVDLNEYKRQQGAPVLKVTGKAFGSGRRTPIVQGWRRGAPAGGL